MRSPPPKTFNLTRMRQLMLSLLAVAAWFAGSAQLSNTGVLYVGNSTTVTTGDFTNTGNFTNNGTTHFTGNISNSQGNMAAGAGTAVFDGASHQTLSGIYPFRSLNVTMNNAAGITLGGRLAVGDGTGGTLTF